MLPARFARLTSILDRRQPDLTVLTDQVHKPHNVSAIIRTCDAVGIFEIHAIDPEASFAPHHLSAGGSGRYVGLRTYATSDAALMQLRQQGFTIVAAHFAPGAVDFRQVDYTRPTALLLGAERDGLSPAAEAGADLSVVIPMLGAVTSLNVSVAAAVILFEAQRQRLDAGLYATSRLDPARRHQILFEWAYPRLAEFCRRKRLPYPRLGPQGELLDSLPRG